MVAWALGPHYRYELFFEHYTLAKQMLQSSEAAAPSGGGAGAPGMMVVSEADLAAAIRVELTAYFHDGCYSKLGQFEVAGLVGSILRRLGPDDVATA